MRYLHTARECQIRVIQVSRRQKADLLVLGGMASGGDRP
jgi:hypothetical protein